MTDLAETIREMMRRHSHMFDGTLLSDRLSYTLDLTAIIKAQFALIPRDQCEPVTVDYELPIELVEDSAAIDYVHHDNQARAITEAINDGLLIITRPVRRQGPVNRFGMVPFKLAATGWRPPDAVREPNLPTPDEIHDLAEQIRQRDPDA